MNEAIRWQLINATLNGDSHRLRVLLSKRVRIDMLQVRTFGNFIIIIVTMEILGFKGVCTFE